MLTYEYDTTVCMKSFCKENKLIIKINLFWTNSLIACESYHKISDDTIILILHIKTFGIRKPTQWNS